MKQRVKLAQALVHDPDLLLLDEPTNGMDPPGREAMLELIRDISRAKGISVILSSHLLPDVKETCTELVVLKDGRVADHRPVSNTSIGERVVYDVRGRGAFAELAAALTQRGHEVLPIDGGLRVVLGSGDGPEPIFEAVVGLNAEVEIRHLVRAYRSMEEQFLEAVS
jgi:ABC-2 type transport system ATP-binding protein